MYNPNLLIFEKQRLHNILNSIFNKEVYCVEMECISKKIEELQTRLVIKYILKGDTDLLEKLSSISDLNIIGERYLIISLFKLDLIDKNNHAVYPNNKTGVSSKAIQYMNYNYSTILIRRRLGKFQFPIPDSLIPNDSELDIDLLDESEKQELRKLILEESDLIFREHNYLIEYKSGFRTYGQFLGDVNTIRELELINPDWANIVLTEREKSSDEYKINKFLEVDKLSSNNIDSEILNLKSILEG